MKRQTEQKIILITQKTRLEELVRRYNTIGQTEYFLSSHGGDFQDYLEEDKNYKKAVETARCKMLKELESSQPDPASPFLKLHQQYMTSVPKL